MPFRAASVFIIGASLGEMVLPLPISHGIEKYPLSFLDYEVAYSVAGLLVFLVMAKVASSRGKRLDRYGIFAQLLGSWKYCCVTKLERFNC